MGFNSAFKGLISHTVKVEVPRISRQSSTVQITLDRKQLEDVLYFDCLGSLIINDARFTREIKSSTVIAKAQFTEKTLFTSKMS